MKIDLIETPKYLDKEVELFGWIDVRRDHGKLIFFDLRDRSGKVQLVVTPSDQDLHKIAETLRPEWVIRVAGRITARPDNMKNPNEPTGEIEVKVSVIEVLAESKTPPFDLASDGREINEESRMRYRYLDLRRPRLKKNLVERARVVKFVRDFLTERGFIEIETPILSKSTPEGARDYLVPSRVDAGNFYALPQSPQQYKQLLMVAGLEKYFQIARCFRDEDTRGDRQPEFTQLDLEMSFTSREEILALTEELYLSLVRKLYPEKKLTLDPDGRIPAMTYREVMEKYKSDRPDLRRDKNDPDELAFLFVVDFPAFEWKETEKRWDATHHPFTKPRVENVEQFRQEFKEKPGEMLADQYDFVLNGYEIGGGSIRVHDPELLRAVFEALGNKTEDIEAQFGHIFEAFRYGVPPHGGIAPGIDRFVMILMGEPNIREVIAFPKTGDGRDLMMGAPSKVSKDQLKELGIEIRKKK
ncbi:MAG: Aspartyl-tRNA synthetase [Candidatus Giovannonibacteria bacterium GW2011_GWA2_45_21]|uniref:Aspartate--tRNA(Asp/Asn) ligase n=1 Tax=Candidatus Giovannonibacteria bacterium GW2011_GWA2_45_21 TaxID=1618649 RepID=A0A0G1Q4X0_9BACT|nr:MAG: Aspartyl-tRNA synthetase [Candidatus Giovannonibacteria bacterium GW2011_GWA2_45_21]